MVDVRGFNGGLNLDASDELLPSGDYKYAMNISNNDAGITKLLGNRLMAGVPESTYEGTEWISGVFLDKKRQRVIYFTNHSRSAHRIISFNLPSISFSNGNYIVLYEEQIFSNDTPSLFKWTSYPEFNPEGLIKDIKVIHRDNEGDLYYFIDPNKKLLKFNYDTIKTRWKKADQTLCAFNWTSANYSGTVFRNGDAIPQVQDATAWYNLTTPAWCWYNNDPANDSKYGKLYNWYAIADARGFAPSGFRVPSDTDWANLITCLGGSTVAGGKMKSTSLWAAPNTGATNESLFNAIPTGYRYIDGAFTDNLTATKWWSSTEFAPGNDDAWSRGVDSLSDDASRFRDPKRFGFSVRLIKES